MNWNKYIHQNSADSKYGMDCQLVTAVNAYYYLTGRTIKQDSARYKELAELGKCCYGACINIKRVWRKLGMRQHKILFDEIDLYDYLEPNCFIEAGVWHKHYRLHSIAIVDYSKKTQAARATNFKYETSTDGWIFIEDLKPFLHSQEDTEHSWHFRTFKKQNKIHQ